MFRIIVTLFLLLASTSVYCQIDSVATQILKYEDSKSTLISKGRNLLLDKFVENDIDKVREVAKYLIEKVQDENYIALFPAEYWLILYWTSDYQDLADNLTLFDSFQVKSLSKRIVPPDDQLWEKLKAKTIESSAKLEKQIRAAKLNNETSEFLLLNLENLTMDPASNTFAQDTINSHAEEFISKYPESNYNNFTKANIRYKLVPKNWGMAFEFFSGYSIYTNRGTLHDNYTNNVPIGVAFDIAYKNFVLYLRDYIGFNKSKTDVDYSLGTFEKDSRTMVFLPETSLGYAVLDNNRFKISPFAGIGAMDIGPTTAATEKIPELSEAALEFTTTYMAGINLDIKFGKKKTPAYSPKAGYGFMRIRYAYNMPQFERNYPGITGNMHYITIGFGAFARGLVRDE